MSTIGFHGDPPTAEQLAESARRREEWAKSHVCDEDCLDGEEAEAD